MSYSYLSTDTEQLYMTAVYIFQQSPSSAYHAYVSPFTLYPSLNDFSNASSSSPFLYNFTPSSSLSSSKPTNLQQLDLQPLRQLTSIDPQQYLCSYEFNDGVCRDERCKDIHQRDLEPTGELTL